MDKDIGFNVRKSLPRYEFPFCRLFSDRQCFETFPSSSLSLGVPSSSTCADQNGSIPLTHLRAARTLWNNRLISLPWQLTSRAECKHTITGWKLLRISNEVVDPGCWMDSHSGFLEVLLKDAYSLLKVYQLPGGSFFNLAPAHSLPADVCYLVTGFVTLKTYRNGEKSPLSWWHILFYGF